MKYEELSEKGKILYNDLIRAEQFSTMITELLLEVGTDEQSWLERIYDYLEDEIKSRTKLYDWFKYTRIHAMELWLEYIDTFIAVTGE